MGASRHSKNKSSNPLKPRKRGRGTTKLPVVVLIETSGKAHAFPVEKVDGATLKPAMEERIEQSAAIVTDELNIYPKAAADFAAHQTVNHSQEEYVSAGGFHTNTAESWFALLKRGVHGTFHHVSKQHMFRYCNEFSFRWSG